DAALHAYVGVVSTCRCLEESNHLVIKVSNSHARHPGVVEIAYVHAHPGTRLPFRAEGNTSIHRHIFESSIALVAIKLIGLGIVGYQQIWPTILVVVEHGDAQRFGAAVENSTGCSRVLESSVAAVAKKPASLSPVSFGRAVRFSLSIETAENVVLRGPLHIVANK